MPTPSGKGKRLPPDEYENFRRLLLDGAMTLHELQEHNDKLLSVVSALESYLKGRGETCWITVCERMAEYRKWRRENGL